MALTKDDAANMTCGGIAGCLSRTAVSPLERLKILYQVQYVALAGGGAQGGEEKYKGMAQALKRIFSEEGSKGFFKGNGANCIRFVLSQLKYLKLMSVQECFHMWDSSFCFLRN